MRHVKGVLAHIVWGSFLGTLCGAAYFLVEPIGLMRDLRMFFGVTLLEVFSVYIAFGVAAGVGSGVLLALIRPSKRPDGGLQLAILGAGFTVLFVVREITLPELRLLPLGIIGRVAGSVIFWALIGWVAARSGRFRLADRGVPVVVALLVAVASLAVPTAVLRAQSSSLPSRSGAQAAAPNVIMIVIDALRRDHLGAYGYPRPNSPTIDALSRDGVRFDNAYSHGNRTIIAMPSLFTSLYPSYHGAIGFSNGAAPLPQSRVTIAELFQSAGYRTVGLMSNVYLKHPFGLTQGFDRTEEFDIARFYLSVYRVLDNLGLAQKPEQKATTADARTVTDEALKWMERLQGDPFFLYVHYMDVHHPYIPPQDVLAEFDGSGVATPGDSLFAWTVELLATPPPLSMPAPARQRLIDLYDACIRYTDNEIARIVDAVGALDDTRPTMIVVTSDHGDEFFEQGSVYHNNLLIEELIRVPLIFWHSGGAFDPRVVAGMSRHVDVLPTLAEIIGAEVPEGIMGRSLGGALAGKAPTGVARSVSEGDYCAAINTPDWKIMYVDSSSGFSLYDLASSGGKAHDVSLQHPVRFDSLRRELESYMAEAALVRQSANETVSEETLRQLRALGYVR